MDEQASLLATYLHEEKPVVLFLGQSFSSGTADDPVLLQLLSRLNREKSAKPNWMQAVPLATEDIQWAAERFERSVYSDSVSNLFDVGWSCVFTTSIDPKISNALETRGRVPESILARDHFPRVPRSRSRPAVHYLLGRADETDLQYRAPKTKLEIKQRISLHANQFINRIAETATPLGLLVIDGFVAEEDWLPVDDLLAPLSLESNLRILWFGVTEPPNSEFYEDLVSKGLITPDSRTLAEVITYIQATTTGEPLGRSSQSEVGTISLKGDTIIQIPPSLRLRVEATAAIVDDTWTENQPPLFGSEEHEAFRQFHGDLGGARGQVEGIARNFAIKRGFEDNLRNQVEKSLKSFAGAENYVVVHGQSGVGKSIALARVAYAMRRELKIPVLFSWGRTPNPHDLDDFCGYAELAGAPGTLILCDANQSIDRYQELATALRSRGRRVVVVGTSYRLEDAQDDRRLIEAPAEMAATEVEALRNLLQRFGDRDNAEIQKILTDKNTLALLYRYLSASRARLIGGVANEARATEQAIRLRAQSVPRGVSINPILAEKLIQAGLANGSVAVFDEDDVTGDAPGRLIDYVMVAGRLDCAVPLNLVMRALRSENGTLDLVQIAYLFKELDLFRWRTADSEGNDLLVQPRLQLEAELICRRRLANPETEIDCLIQLISAVRPSSVDRGSELGFLLDLLPKLNRDGPRSRSYETGYLRIAHALTTLRTVHKVVESRLILQESAFRRATVHLMDRPAFNDVRNPGDPQREEILNDAREVVEFALDEIGKKKLHASRKTHHNLLNERASIYGYLTVSLARTQANEDEIWANYLAARTAISAAISVAGGYYPQDVGMWAPYDVLQAAKLSLSPIRRAELKADILSVIDDVDVSLLTSVSAEKFLARRLRVAQGIGEDDIAQEALLELEKVSPSVAYFLQARSICSELFGDLEEPFSIELTEKAKVAAKYLEDRLDKISGDVRPLLLLLQLQWIGATRHRLLRSERFPIPADRTFQKKILSTVADLNQAAPGGARNVFRFLEATLEWVQGDTSRSRELFRALASDSEFEDPGRVVRRLVLQNHSDLHQGFRGRVEKERSKGHWVISVGGFQGTIDLLERDFGHEDIKPGRQLDRFNIAFNYLGPIADPILRHGGSL